MGLQHSKSQRGFQEACEKGETTLCLDGTAMSCMEHHSTIELWHSRKDEELDVPA